jgi:hypothetical protein
VDVPTYCGRCDREIPAGEPLLVLTVVGVRALHRCADCEGPAPPELPAQVVQHSTTRPMIQLFAADLSLASLRKTAKTTRMPYRDD